MKTCNPILVFSLFFPLSVFSQNKTYYLAPGVEFQLESLNWTCQDILSTADVLPDALLSFKQKDDVQTQLTFFTDQMENSLLHIDSSDVALLISEGYGFERYLNGSFSDTSHIQIGEFWGFVETSYFSTCIPFTEEEKSRTKSQCNMQLAKRFNEDFWMFIHCYCPGEKKTEMMGRIKDMINSIVVLSYNEMDAVFQLPWSKVVLQEKKSKYALDKFSEHLMNRKAEMVCSDLRATDYVIIRHKGENFFDSLMTLNEIDKLDTVYSEIMSKMDLQVKEKEFDLIFSTAYSYSEKMRLESELRNVGFSFDEVFACLNGESNTLTRLIDLGHDILEQNNRIRYFNKSILPRLEKAQKKILEESLIKRAVTQRLQHNVFLDTTEIFLVQRMNRKDPVLFSFYSSDPQGNGSANFILRLRETESGKIQPELIRVELPIGTWKCNEDSKDFLDYSKEQNSVYSPYDIVCYPIHADQGKWYNLTKSKSQESYALEFQNQNYSTISRKEGSRYVTCRTINLEMLTDKEIDEVIKRINGLGYDDVIRSITPVEAARYKDDNSMIFGDTIWIDRSVMFEELQNVLDVNRILYESGFIFQDLNEDGSEEVFQFSLSNGILNSYVIYTLSEGNLEMVTSKKWLQLLKRTDAFINLSAHSRIGCHTKN